MEIEFDSGKLEKIFNSVALLRREYGDQADKIMIRMAVLRSARCLALVPDKKPDRRHQLSGDRKGCFAVDLRHPFRLVFRPAHSPLPLKDDGGIDLWKVTAVRIVTVEDYH